MSRKHITQLIVGGFQVFADQVTIPLGPLTLLYGPNSAGKSAILDAMLALADLCELRAGARSSDESNDQHRLRRILGRHWRRQGTNPPAPTESLQLGATIRIAGEDWAEAGFAEREGFVISPLVPNQPKFDEPFRILQPLLTASHVDVGVSFKYQSSERGTQIAHDVLAQEQRIEVRIGGSPILQFQEAVGWAAINLNHEALRDWTAAAGLKWVAEEFGEAFLLQDGWFAQRLSYLMGGGWLGSNAVDSLAHRLADDEEARVREAQNSFIGMFEALFRASLRSLSTALRVPLVPASRTVPQRSEVTFLFAADAAPLPSDLFGIQVNGLPAHLEITRSAFILELERCGLRRPPEDWLGIPPARPPKDPVDLVNRLLGDYLFRSSGYFVAAGVHELKSLGVRDPDDVQSNTGDAGRRFLASLELCDAAGRRFNFDEVGSGLGYVLPVFLTLATSEAAFLQQPELHLHPALQSELADALVAVLRDADFVGPDSERCSQIIAETHSEHLLLRLLRRVRQASDPKHALDPRSLRREDIVVLYVDPRPDGTSTAKHLRIARDGEFIDRWPKGFFEERWTELFDE